MADSIATPVIAPADSSSASSHASAAHLGDPYSEQRWTDALRQAQAELDELRDRHSQERLLLEVKYQRQQHQGGATVHRNDLPPLSGDEDSPQVEPSIPHSSLPRNHSPNPFPDDVGALQQRCIALEAKLSLSNEEVAALRQSNARLLSSESRYRERADQLQSQLTLLQSSIHSNAHTRAQLAQLSQELQAMEMAMQAQRDDVDRREQHMRSAIADVEGRMKRKKEGWKKERDELRRGFEERERALKELMVQQLEQREEATRKVELELTEVSLKHRQEWQQKEEQLFRCQEENKALSDTVEGLKAEVGRLGRLQSECTRLEGELQRLTSAHQRREEEVEEWKGRVHDVELRLQQQVEITEISERFIEQLKVECGEKDEGLSHRSQQISSLQALVDANQAAIQREQQQSLRALEVMQSELEGYRQVHLSMVELYDVQMQQMREQLQSVLMVVVEVEERAKSGVEDDGSRVSARKVVDMMQLVMQQIQQQDMLIRAMDKQHKRPRTPSSHTPPPHPPRTQQSKHVLGKERKRGEVLDKKGVVGVDDEVKADGDRLVSIPLIARISHLQLQLAHTEQQLASQRQRAAQLSSQAEKREEELQSLTRPMTELKRELSHERQQSQRREREWERRVKELQDTHPYTVAQWEQLTRQLEDSQSTLHATIADLQRQAELRTSAEQSVEQLRLELEESEKRLSRHHAAAQKKDAELAEVVRELEDIRRVESKLREEERLRKAEVDELNRLISALRDDLAHSEAAVKAREVEAKQAVTEGAQLRDECQRLQKEKDRLHTERERGMQREAALQREIDALQTTMTSANEALRRSIAETASLGQRVEELKVGTVEFQRQVEDHRATHSHVVHFLRDLLHPHLLRLQSSYSSLHRRHLRRLLHRHQQRQRLKEEQRQRSPQDGLDSSSVSAAAVQAGLELSMGEVEDLLQAGREEKEEEEEKSEEEQMEEEELHRRNRVLQEVNGEWETAFASAAADEPRFSSAWMERIGRVAQRLLGEELRIERMEGQHSQRKAPLPLRAHPPGAPVDVDEAMLQRYQQTVAEVKARLTEQHRVHASAVSRYQSRVTDLLGRLRQCRCEAAIRPSGRVIAQPNANVGPPL